VTSLQDAAGRASVGAVVDVTPCRRRVTLTTTVAERRGGPTSRVVEERAGQPTLRTGNLLVDALYALTLEEVREAGVDAISDGAFDNGAPLSCGAAGCFETGELWTWVWTRDTAYAIDLGLGAHDAARARQSLEFKLAGRKPDDGDVQVVQDTGSGGSWPVSSDRVVWALGARRLLGELSGPARDAFAATTLRALKNTVEQDRVVVFDPAFGLYRGEQSFLDWREQSYPDFTRDDVAPIAMGYALGTNLLHLAALELIRDLSLEQGNDADVTRYGDMAADLRSAIRARFIVDDGDGVFSTLVPGLLDPAPARRFDTLSSSLAVLLGVATPTEARAILDRTPHYGPGVPVFWPQQQDTAIYHNRAAWPFVTSYWLKAAKAADHDGVGVRAVSGLVRGTGLFLSNMENMEAARGAVFVEEGETSGPVVNSRRQLWSVAGFLSMVEQTLFGLDVDGDALRVTPWIPAGLVNGSAGALWTGSDTLVLNGHPWRGKRVTVVLHLPTQRGGAGVLPIVERRLNGVVVAGDAVAFAGLDDGDNRIDVVLGPPTGQGRVARVVSDSDYQRVFGPRTPPSPGLAVQGDRIVLSLSPGNEARADVTFRVLRDGVVLADGLPGATTTFTDPDHRTTSPRSPCYVVETSFVRSGTRSWASAPNCFWGPAFERIVTVGAADLAHVGGVGSLEHGLFHYEPWGDAGDSLTLPSFQATQSGPHLVQVIYGNGAGDISTGITCGVKKVRVFDGDTVVGEGMVVMPQLGTWARWEDSTFVPVDLVAGRRYRIVVGDDPRATNMSSRAHYRRYTGGTGGGTGDFNRVNIAELKVLAR